MRYIKRLATLPVVWFLVTVNWMKDDGATEMEEMVIDLLARWGDKY